jgi:hypothetical protein
MRGLGIVRRYKKNLRCDALLAWNSFEERLLFGGAALLLVLPQPSRPRSWRSLGPWGNLTDEGASRRSSEFCGEDVRGTPRGELLKLFEL